MRATTTGTLANVDAGQWNALTGTHPFTRHAFIHQMAESGSASTETGWRPCHFIMEGSGGLTGCSPAWIKHHSHGEFVFDWHWADFYRRMGRPYYPKLLVGVPYSPITGPRLAASTTEHAHALIQAQLELARTEGLSGIHWNFLTRRDAIRLDEALPGLIARLQWQFHWFNDGYRDFDHFLSRLKRKRRKNILQERRKLGEYRFLRIPGSQASERQWHFAWQMYRRTFLEKGNHPAIRLEFFLQTITELDYLLILAEKAGEPVACALFLQDGHTLYGRYWGCTEPTPGLHFETCYYQGIEHCIQQGLQRFEPGAQGEHKLARGFLPVACISRHWLADTDLAGIVKNHAQNEMEMMLIYGQELTEHQPYQEPPVHDSLAFC